MTEPGTLVDAAIVRLLLRYFRRGSPVVLAGELDTTREDSDLVVFHWAMSAEIELLASHLTRSPHETELVLVQERTESSGLARGRVDAVGTLMAQRRSGDVARVISFAPSRHADHGINRLLVWVIKRASEALDRLAGLIAADSPYFERCTRLRAALVPISRSSGVADLFRSVRLSNRPTAGDVRHAARHRRALYRLGAAAYSQLLAVERGDPSAIAATLHESVVAPIEPWRRFEMLTALAIADTIARRVSAPLSLEILTAGGASKPIARCGEYEVHWQSRTPHYTEPALEPSEQLTANICSDFGIVWGADRPDVVVVDASAGRVIALAEAKFIGGTPGHESNPLSDAIEQLVRYSRGYGPEVLGASVIAMSRLPSSVWIGQPCARSPFAIDLNGLLNAALDDWPLMSAVRQNR